MNISLREIDLVCATVQRMSGIYLDSRKSYLIENRLRPLLQTYDFKSYLDLVNALQGVASDNRSELRRDFLDAITTNETLFFRDGSPFDAFEFKMLPEAWDRIQSEPGSRPLRIWSAACSTGQEAYSLAIRLAEMLDPAERVRVEIMASDICETALGRAMEGWYPEHETDRGLPDDLRDKYFERKNNGWNISPAIRKMVKFEQRNLLDPLTLLPKFDIVFCRNVAMYFSSRDRQKLFDSLARIMQISGFLVIGSSEYYDEMGVEFQREEHCRSVVYRHGGQGVIDHCSVSARISVLH